jgi:hypothetical protein
MSKKSLAVAVVTASMVAAVTVSAIAGSQTAEWTCPGSGEFFAVTESLRAEGAVGAATPEAAVRESIPGALTPDERAQLSEADTSEIPIQFLREEGEYLIYGADITAISDRSNLEIRVAPAEAGGYYFEGLRVCLTSAADE